MATAYILVYAESGAEQKVAEELALLDFVKDVDIVYGEYDVIAKIMSDDIDKLTGSILSKIRPIPGVSKTSTLIVAN